MANHDAPRIYFATFLTLLLLLAITCAVAFIDLDRLPGGCWSIAVAMLIAIAKAVLILLFFMHVKSGPKRVYVFCGAGFLWLGILFVLTFSDYLSRNHPPGESPKGEPRFLITHQATP
jgi:cytochrome c oxidase subunit 4